MAIKKSQIFILGLGMSIILSLVPFKLFGVPTVFFPMPLYLVISAMMNISWLFGACLFGFIWILFQDKDLETFKKRSLLLNVFLLVTTFFWFLFAKDYAIKHQGLTHYCICLFENILFIGLLCWSRYNPTNVKVRFYSFLVTFFLLGFAIPYFGELP